MRIPVIGKMRNAFAALYCMASMATIPVFTLGSFMIETAAHASIQVQDPYDAPTLEELIKMKRSLSKVGKAVSRFGSRFDVLLAVRYQPVRTQFRDVKERYQQLESVLGQMIEHIQQKDVPRLSERVHAIESLGDPYFLIKERIADLYENVVLLEKINSDLGVLFCFDKGLIYKLKSKIVKMASHGRYIVLDAKAK